MLSFVAMAARPAARPASANPVRLLLVGFARSGEASRQHLEARGYELIGVEALEDAAPLLAAKGIDLVILDGRRGGDEVLAQCRALAKADCRLIVIHAPTDQALGIEALEAGADDCLPSKHNSRELVARVRAVLRRRRKAPVQECGRFQTFGDLALDIVRHELRSRDGGRVSLTPHQFKLLTALLARPGEVVARHELFDLVQGEDSESFDRAVDVHVSRLRKRLMELTGADLITAYRGIGYRLNVRARAMPESDRQ